MPNPEILNQEGLPVCPSHKIGDVDFYAWSHGGRTLSLDVTNSAQLGDIAANYYPYIFIDGLMPEELLEGKTYPPNHHTYPLITDAKYVIAGDFLTPSAYDDLVNQKERTGNIQIAGMLGGAALLIIDRLTATKKGLSRRSFLQMIGGGAITLSLALTASKSFNSLLNLGVADNINSCQEGDSPLANLSERFSDAEAVDNAARTLAVTRKLNYIPPKEFTNRGLPVPERVGAFWGPAHFMFGVPERTRNSYQNLLHVQADIKNLVTREMRHLTRIGVPETRRNEILLSFLFNVEGLVILKAQQTADAGIKLIPVPDSKGNIYIPFYEFF